MTPAGTHTYTYTYRDTLPSILITPRTPFQNSLSKIPNSHREYLPNYLPFFFPLLNVYSRTFALEQVAVLALDCRLIE